MIEHFWILDRSSHNHFQLNPSEASDQSYYWPKRLIRISGMLPWGRRCQRCEARGTSWRAARCQCLCFLLLLHVDVRIHMFVLWNLSQCKIPLQFKKKEKNPLPSINFGVFFLFVSVMLLHPQFTRGHKLPLSRSSLQISLEYWFKMEHANSSLGFLHMQDMKSEQLNKSEHIRVYVHQ